MKRIVPIVLVVAILGGAILVFALSRNQKPAETPRNEGATHRNAQNDSQQAIQPDKKSNPPRPVKTAPLKLSERRHDFGTIYSFQQASHTFPFTNSTDKRIRITRVKVECNCSNVKVLGSVADGKEFFEPDEKGEILTTVKTGKKLGEFSGIVKIFADVDIKNPQLLLVSGKVVPAYTLSPEYIDFGSVEAGKGSKKVLQFSPATKLRFKITKIKSYAEFLDARVLPDEDGNQRTHSAGNSSEEVEVTLKANAPQGLFSKTIEIYTDSGFLPPIRVNVRGKVMPPEN